MNWAVRILVAVFLFWGEARASTWSPTFIYGEDSRLEFFQAPAGKKRELFESSAAMVNRKYLSPESGGLTKVLGLSYGEHNRLCRNEPFYEQQSLASCSASLVAEDIVLTAGHCLSKPGKCGEVSFVFGYFRKDEGDRAEYVNTKDIYECKELLYQVGDEHSQGPDFALVRLDRTVEGRVPVEIRKGGAMKGGEAVFAIGYPKGLPAKLAHNAKVLGPSSADQYFRADLDMYQNNSGSPVFSSTGKLVGILIGGAGEDFVLDRAKGCYVSNRCSGARCEGEDIFGTTAIAKELEKFRR